MSQRPQDTSAEEPDGGNPHIRFWGGPGLGNRPGLLNSSPAMPMYWAAGGQDRPVNLQESLSLWRPLGSCATLRSTRMIARIERRVTRGQIACL